MSHLMTTNHGVSIEVPKLVGTQISDVADSLSDIELRFEIRDSVYQINILLGWLSTRSITLHAKVRELKANRRII